MHRPNLNTRQQVQAWAAGGATQAYMAQQLGITDRTLREHYRTELDSGVRDANATVASKLYELAIGGNVTACIFWLKTRARWRVNQTLKVAYTKHPMPIVQKTASTWTADQDQVGTYDTLEQLATAVVDATENGSNGPVSIVAQNGKLVVFDGSYKPKAKTLVFTDLIGQPTWIRPDTMQVQLVLRADLEVGGIIEMPKGYANAPGAVTTTAAAYPSRIKYGPTFQHQFQITKLRQVGNFRSTNGADWSTEPPRILRRLFGVSHAALGNAAVCR